MKNPGAAPASLARPAEASFPPPAARPRLRSRPGGIRRECGDRIRARFRPAAAQGSGPVQAGQIKAFRCALDLRKEHFPPLTQGGMAAQIGVGKVKPVHPQGLKPGCVRRFSASSAKKAARVLFPPREERPAGPQCGDRPDAAFGQGVSPGGSRTCSTQESSNCAFTEKAVDFQGYTAYSITGIIIAF